MEEKIEFTSFQELTTESLVLRMLKTSDENEIFILRSDDDINKYISMPKVKHKAEAMEFISKILDGIIKNKAFISNECWYQRRTSFFKNRSLDGSIF